MFIASFLLIAYSGYGKFRHRDRILKTGGEAIISDFKHTSEYKKGFETPRMKVKKEGTYFLAHFRLSQLLNQLNKKD